VTTSIIMSTTARIAESRGHLGEALEIAADAVRRADMSPGRVGHRFPVRVTQGRLLIALDRLPEARSALSAGVRVSEELGVRWALATHRVYLACERFAAGHWDDALAELEVSIKVAEEAGETDSLVFAYGLLSRISLHRNDLHRAREAADAGDRYRAGWGRGHAMSWVAWPRALICEAEGQDGQALSTMAALWDWCADSGQVPELPVIGADLVRLALATGDVARARQAVDAVAEVAARNDLAWMTGEALRCRGLADDDPEALHASVAAHGRGSRPLRLAMACEDAGSCLARHGQAERARPLLDQAAGGYERLGPAAVRLGQHHPDRAFGRGPGRRRAVQSADRRAPVHLEPDRADAPGARLRQAGHFRARPARGRGNPAQARLMARLARLGGFGRVLQEAPEVLDVGPFGILGPDRDPHRPHAVQ